MMIFAFTRKKTSRREGIVSTSPYIAYMAYIIMRAYNIWIF